MPYKICPQCGITSYSSSDTGEWECPGCGEDLKDISSFNNKFS